MSPKSEAHDVAPGRADPPGGLPHPSPAGERAPGAKWPVAIYGRNSKPPKGWKPSHPGDSPPGSWAFQLQVCRKAAIADGHEIVWEGHDVASGGDPNRPQWAELMALVRGGRVRAVYVTKLDRVMRSLAHFLEVADAFEKRGAWLVFVDSPLASVKGKDPFAKAMRGNLAVFAELERDLAWERSMSVLEVREDGRTYGPRSERPAGAPRIYGDGHKMRKRDGKLWHDRARCPLCRVAEPGVPRPEGGGPENERVA